MTTNHSEALRQQGFTIIPDLMPGGVVTDAREACGQWMVEFDARSIDGGTVRGRYRKGLLPVTRMFDDVYTHPLLLDIAGDQFEPDGYVFGGAMIKNVVPGEDARAMHHDDVIFTADKPNRGGPGWSSPCMINVLVALDDFTPETGATHIVPGSHLWDRPVEQDHECISAEMPAGSAIVLHGRVWHQNGPNTSFRERRALAFTYRTRRVKKAWPSETVGNLPEKLKRLM